MQKTRLNRFIQKYNLNGNVILQGGNYSSNNFYSSSPFCMSAATSSCFYFNMYDSYGDGSSGGNYTVLVNNSAAAGSCEAASIKGTIKVEPAEEIALVSLNSRFNPNDLNSFTITLNDSGVPDSKLLSPLTIDS